MLGRNLYPVIAWEDLDPNEVLTTTQYNILFGLSALLCLRLLASKVLYDFYNPCKSRANELTVSSQHALLFSSCRFSLLTLPSVQCNVMTRPHISITI